MPVDYQKLSEQYAGFLAALGGVSITVLTLVLSLDPASVRRELRPFLVASLIVATLSSFTGGHQMAETAAYIEKTKKTGERLFLLASTNIFLATIIAIFSLMLLPAGSGKEDSNSIRWLSFLGFLFVTLGAFCWMCLGATSRMPLFGSKYIWLLVLLLLAAGITTFFLPANFLIWIFIFVAALSAFSLFYFGFTFNRFGDVATKSDMIFFCLTITATCAFLIPCGVRLLFFGEEFKSPSG